MQWRVLLTDVWEHLGDDTRGMDTVAMMLASVHCGELALLSRKKS